jgi:hydrogenase maturation protein HypF
VVVAPSIAPGNPRLGIMLAYTPLQHLLFAQGAPEALVMTSGNRSEEPISYTEEQAFERLGDIADGFLVGERGIHTRCDDSVVQVVAGEPQFLRRSRGYVPLPIDLPFDAHGVLAVGGELKNTFAIGRKGNAFVGHHIGDLKNVEEYDAFRAGIEQFKALVEVEPTLVARDLHPMYLSSGYADRLVLPLETVQHHHAHIASVMAEHRLENQQVIGVAFDGTGFGEDGTIWGAEFLIADYAGFRRAVHFRDLPLAGGDAAIKRNWRSAAAYLLRFLSAEETLAALGDATEEAALHAVIRMIEQNVNCAPASSAGRLFDAVASVVGVRHHDSFEGQGAMELEALAHRGTPESCYTFLSDDNILDPTPAIEAVVTDMRSGVTAADIAARFHASLAAAIVETCGRLSAETGITTVCLSGGTFQNRLLCEQVISGLRERRLTPLSNRLVPPNDGGISLGQLAVAAYRRKLCA